MRPIALVASLLAAIGIAGAAEAPLAPAPAPAPAATAAAPAPDDATRIAADIIKTRALDAAEAGNLELSSQLRALAKGLVEGRVTLYDASLVMQMAGTPRHAATPAAAPMTAEARAGAQHATALLDGDGGQAASTGAAPTPSTPVTPPGPPKTMSATDPAPPLTVPTQPAGKALIAKVYAIDNGADGKANVAAIGVGANNGVLVGQVFFIKRKGLTVAQCKVVRVQPSLSYCEVIKNSLVDPKDDVREGDQATTAP